MNKSSNIRIAAEPLMPILLGTLVFSILATIAWRLEKKGGQDRAKLTQSEAVKIGKIIQVDLENRILSYERIASRWTMRGGTPKDEFMADAMAYINDYAGIQAISWVDPSYHVKWIVPLEGNELAQGLDLSIEPRRLLGIQKAVKNRKSTLTGSINLIQGGTGALFYVPIFVHDQFDGLISVVIRFQEWLQYLFSDEKFSELDQYVISVRMDNDLIYQDQKQEQPSQEHSKSVNITLFDHSFTITCYPTLKNLKDSHSNLPLLVLIFGAVLSPLLSLSAHLLQKNRHTVERINQRKEELEASILKQQQSEQLLAHERQRLSHILMGTNAGSWEWNVQTGETIFNERWANIIGYTLEEIQPTSIETWVKFSHPDDLKKSGELLEKTFSRESDFYEIEARMRHKDGSWIWVLDRGKVFEWTPEGKPLMMFGTHQDITERKNLEERIIRMERLFYHDVLNNAIGIKNLIELHDDEGFGLSHEEFNEIMESLADILMNDIQSQRDFSKTLSGTLKVNPVTINSSELLQKIERVYKYATYGKNIKLLLAEPILFESDPVLLLRIIGNLLKNAIEASLDGQTITLQCQRVEPDIVRFSVHNEQVIPLAIQEQLFNEVISTKKEGRGFGTQSIKLLGEKYLRGYVHFISKEGIGTTFFIDLPEK